MNLTTQQESFIDALLNSASNLCLRARAGTGKTSTSIAGVVRYAAAFPEAEITLCMFNKKNQIETAEKLKAAGLDDWKRYSVQTSHAMGNSLVSFVFRRPKVSDYKVRDLIRAQNAPVYSEYAAQIAELVHLAKTEGFGFFDDCQVGDYGAWYRLADHYNVNGLENTNDMDSIIRAAICIYNQSLSETSVIDFDDMILFPLVKNLRVKFQRDLILVDEAQDTSRARRALIKKFLKPGGRMVVVGDDRQAIMGFAGASADALDELIAELSAEILPLTMTWRCPRAVVREAQKIVPDLEAAESAIEGSVTHEADLPETFAATDAILCRNVAPLIDTAYKLIRRGVACRVEGREIGNGLLRMVDRWKAIKTIGAFLDKLDDYQDRETQKAIAKGKDNKVDEIEDRCETMRHICRAVADKGSQSLDDVRTFIRDLFADDVRGVVTLCTYHRSKGREWPRVMLLEHATRCPSKRAKQEWELKQESNLAYVAITRAQESLVYIR